jgi:TP901 family phage tail tape measure protein
MSDLNIALVLKFIDQATAPARAAMQNIQGAAEAVQRFGNKQIEAGRVMQETAAANTAALRGPTMATVGMAAAIVASMQPAIAFEAQMDKVAAVSGATAEEQTALARAAMEQGARTQFSATQSAEALTFLSMAGFSANEQMTVLPGVLDLAAAAGTSLGETANHATNMLSAFGLEASEMGRVGDVLVNAFTSSNTDLNGLAATMSYAAPVAKGLGVEIEEVAAMAGLLGDQGIAGERAGTALRAVLQRLVAPSTEASKAMDSLGVNIADADGNMRPLLDILAEMDTAMAKMGDVAKESMNAVIFGAEAAGAAGILMERAGNGSLQSYAERLHQTGSAARVAAQMSDNTRGAINRLVSALEGVSIAAGSAFLPVLTEIANRLSAMVVPIFDWVSANQELMTTVGWVVAGLMGLSLGALAAQWAFWLLFGWVGKLRVAFGMLLRANPLVLLGIAAAAAVYMIYDSWDGIVSYFQEKFDRVKAAFGNSFLGGLRTLWAEFNVFTLMMDAIEGVLRYLGEAFNIDLFTQGANMIESLRRGIWSVLTDMVAAVKSYLASIIPDRLIAVWEYMRGDGEPATPSTGSSGRAAGRRDSGGVVRPGFLYEINERAQEFFAPNLPGSVLRGTDLRGGGRAQSTSRAAGDVITINVYGSDGRDVVRQIERVLRDRDREKLGFLHDGAMA